MTKEAKWIKDKKFDVAKIGKTNPFANEKFKIVVNNVVDQNILVRDGAGGLTPLEKEYEREYTTKLYTKPDNRKKIAKLNGAAKELYLWIAYKLTWGQDWILVNRHNYMKEHNIGSVNTYKKGVEELVVAQILHTTVVIDVFWINPAYFFCGSRTDKYPDHVEVYQPKNKEDAEQIQP